MTSFLRYVRRARLCSAGRLGILAGTMLNALQTLMTLSSIEIDWIEPLGPFPAVVASLSFDLVMMKVGCVLQQGAFADLIGRMCSPVIVTLSLLSIFVVKKYLKPTMRLRMDCATSGGSVYSVLFISSGRHQMRVTTWLALRSWIWRSIVSQAYRHLHGLQASVLQCSCRGSGSGSDCLLLVHLSVVMEREVQAESHRVGVPTGGNSGEFVKQAWRAFALGASLLRQCLALRRPPWRRDSPALLCLGGECGSRITAFAIRCPQNACVAIQWRMTAATEVIRQPSLAEG